MKWLLAIGAFALSIGIAQADTLRTFKVANWDAGAYAVSGTRTFSHCAASAGYNSGIAVYFSINRKYAWSMGFGNPQWRLVKDQEYDIAFSIDGSSPIFAKARGINAGLARVDLVDSTELFAQFRRGRVLQVAAASQVFNFNLDGTSALLPALLACVRQELTPAGSNPFAAQSASTPNRSVPSRGALQAEAALMAANVLGAAGIDGFSFGSLEQAAKFKADALWTSGSLVGTVKIADGVSLDNPEIPSVLIGDDAKSCKGAFLSGSLPESDGKSMLRIFTSCQDQKQTLTVYYLAVRRPKGGIYLFTTMSTGAQEAVKDADSGLRTAVFKVVR